MKSFNRTKFIVILFAFFTLGIYSCEPEQTETEQNLTYLPRVLSSDNANSSYLIKIKNLNISLNGRINESLNFTDAITATYEGYEEMEFVYVSSNEASNIYHLYIFKKGILSENVLTIENNPDSMKISNEAGSINVDIEDNIVKDVNVNYYSINERTECDGCGEGDDDDCGLAEGWLECHDAVQEQLVDAVGSWGAAAFDIGCSIWVVCRGAYAVACATYALEKFKNWLSTIT